MSTGVEQRPRLELASLEMLGHAIFAITMTLLVLDVRLPADYPAGHLWDAVWDLRARLAAYVFGFVYLTASWLEFRRGFHRHRTLEMSVQICWLMMLCTVALTPFLVSMLASSVGNSNDLATAVRLSTVVVCLENLLGALGVYLHHRPARTLTPHGVASMAGVALAPAAVTVALTFVLPWLALALLTFGWLLQLATDRLRRLWVRTEPSAAARN